MKQKLINDEQSDEIRHIGHTVDWDCTTVAHVRTLILDLMLIREKLKEIIGEAQK